MAEKYEGWNLYDKVIIVGKVMTSWNQETRRWEITDTQQGYVVDPKSKTQLENALRWADTTVYDYDGYENKYSNKTDYPGVVNEFDNEGFEIELLESANGSWQGGKLSFWNCKISKGDQSWIIGINADLLLRALVSCTWVNGKCQEPVMFARCKGGVGILSKSSPEYIQAQADMERKASMSKGKTTKYKVGHFYETVTESELYFGKIYCWYEPIHEKASYGGWNKLIGFKRLDKPVVKELMMGHNKNLTTAKDYLEKEHYYHYKDKCPSRKEGESVEWNITKADIDAFLKKQAYYQNTWTRATYEYSINESHFGYSTDAENPLIYTQEEKDFFKEKCGITIED